MPEERLSTLRLNLEALHACEVGFGIVPRDCEERLRAHLARGGEHASGQGRLGIGRAGQDAIELRAAADRAPLPFLTSAGGIDPVKPPRPIVLEGINPPWLFERICRATPRMPDGYQPRIIVVQQDLDEFLEGLSRQPMAELLGEERISFVVGENAGARLAGLLNDMLDVSLPDCYVQTPGLRRAVREPAVPEIIRSARDAQQREHASLLTKVQRKYAERDAVFWRCRFESSGTGLRVLLPISRYSTFVRHSAADLAESLRALGHEARILTEPDDFSKLASPAYLRAFAEFEPDLVVLINYTRAHMGAAIPQGVPFVCWIQDRMAHLFHESPGRAQGELDFLFGHLHPELFSLWGYPACRSRLAFVPASARTFHDGPVDPALRRQFECEIAYVSHQSETPEAAHARLREMFRTQPALLPAADALFARLARIARGEERFDPEKTRWAELVENALSEQGIRDPDPRLVNTILGNFVQPIAERLHRHTALAWAAEIARRRGWRFHIHGRGWEVHPALREFARPPLEHDEQLRAAYQSARCHLHIALSTNAHQRVAECALSGGLVLRRGPTPDHHLVKYAFRRHLVETVEPASREPDGIRRWILEPAAADCPSRELAQRYLAYLNFMRGRAGLAAIERIELALNDEARAALLARPPCDPMTFPDLAFPCAAETLFHDPVELERMIERAVTDDDWRAMAAGAQHDVAAAHWTYDLAASRIVDLVRSGLSRAAEPHPCARAQRTLA